MGAGDAPSVILMAGARTQDEQILYPVSELAARYGATRGGGDERPEAGVRTVRAAERGRPAYWDALPWA